MPVESEAKPDAATTAIASLPRITCELPRSQPELRADINQLNRSIDLFNQTIANPTISQQEKIDCLQQVMLKRDKIEDDYPASFFHESIFQGFNQSFRHDFDQALQQTASALAIAPEQPKILFAQLLAEMPAAVLEKLADAMLEATAKSTQAGKPVSERIADILRENYPEGHPDTASVDHLLNHYAIAFLGGNNSRNFTLTPCDPNSSEATVVISLKSDLNIPRKYQKLAAQNPVLANWLTPTLFERPVSREWKKGDQPTYTSAIAIAQYYPSRDPMACRPADPKIAMKNAIVMGSQMAMVMTNIRLANLFLPDAKSENWTAITNPINRNEIVAIKLADKKSFCTISENGKFQHQNDNNEHYLLVTTKEYYPPECDNASFSADKAHAFILGKNLLYCYLSTNKHEEEALKQLPLDEQIQLVANKLMTTPEETEECQLLQLIANLLQNDPANRPTVMEAQKTLLTMLDRENQLIPLLDQLITLEKKDVNITERRFIQAAYAEISTAAELSPERITELSSELAAKINQVDLNLAERNARVDEKMQQFQQLKAGVCDEEIDQAIAKITADNLIQSDDELFPEIEFQYETLKNKLLDTLRGDLEAYVTIYAEDDELVSFSNELTDSTISQERIIYIAQQFQPPLEQEKQKIKQEIASDLAKIESLLDNNLDSHLTEKITASIQEYHEKLSSPTTVSLVNLNTMKEDTDNDLFSFRKSIAKAKATSTTMHLFKQTTDANKTKTDTPENKVKSGLSH